MQRLKKKQFRLYRFSHYSWKFFFLFTAFLNSGNSFGQSLYSATGKATFYARKFEGRKTASGEKFSNKNFTAAHRTLPLGTLVKVTNLTNNVSVIVRINDRGPFIKGRLIDLSRAAADSLDFIHSGWAMVKIEELPPEISDTVAGMLPDSSIFRFPQDWLGHWKGELKIYSSAGLKQLIPVEMQILPTALPDRFLWTIMYDTLVKNYELVIHDSAQNQFSLDERNGIDIRSSLLGNHFSTRFSVEGQLIESEYTLLSENEMQFEIRAGGYQRVSTTGKVTMQADSIPEVSVFSIEALQEAELHRVKE